MGELLGETVRVEDLTVQRAEDRADPLVLHGHPFELLDSDQTVELIPSLFISMQHLGADDYRHTILGLAEYLGAGVPEGLAVGRIDVGIEVHLLGIDCA